MKSQHANLRAVLMTATMLAPFICAGAAFAQDTSVEEVVVTANRREQVLSKVPASVAVMTQEKMDAQGVHSIDDIALLTPGLNFSRGSQFTGSNTNISIRGISSTVGAATTGIYIDDVPIQTRAVGFSTSNTYPKVFDLERVEVLRGPQGTLFGAGSEGGAVRFITPQPGMNGYSVYGRSELSFTDGGEPNYEVGLAGGGPIIEDKLAFRASAFFRQDGGWIDRAPGGVVQEKNSNDQKTVALKGALTWEPIAGLQVTPGLYYQKVETGDSSAYWETLSNPKKGDFRNGATQAQPVTDRFFLPSLNVRYDLGFANVISTTAYFDRQAKEHRDYTNFDVGLLTPTSPFPTLPGQVATGFLNDSQKIFTQEVRLESKGDGKLKWIAGAFYSRDRQEATQQNQDSFYEQMLINLYGLTLADLGSAYLPGDLLYDSRTRSDTRQIAGFGQVDYSVTDKLTLTAGVRVAQIKVRHDQSAQGFWAGAGIASAGTSTETAATPKFGIAYQANPTTLFYASAAKGYRPGGAQTAVPTSLCGADLAAMGLTGSPTAYESDSVWSYEGGAKKGMFNGRLQADLSLFYIKWNNIQRFVDLPLCGSGFIANTGSATSKGFDLSLQGRVTDNLTLGVVLGYTDATFDETVIGGATAILVEKGDSSLDGPGLTFTVSGQYDFKVLNDKDAYARFDYSYAGKEEALNPRVFGVNLEDRPAPQTEQLNLRAGVKLDNFDVSLFANNLTNEHAGLSRLQTFPGAPLFTNVTYRPRTIGITASYRY